MVELVLKKVGVYKEELSVIVFIKGLGLIGFLMVGVFFGKVMVLSFDIFLIEVYYMKVYVMVYFVEILYLDFFFFVW